VIIPVGPGKNHLDSCLESLEHCRPPANEIVVVVDGAGDEVAEQARRFGTEVVVQHDPTGPAAARNHGVRRARSEILLFIDSDVEVQPDLVGRVALMLSGDGEPSAVFGSYDADPSAPGLVSKYRNLLHHWVHQHSREEASTFWSGCGAIRRAAFDDAAGFPESYPDPSVEDIAFGARIRARGHGVRLDPALQVRHLKRWTLANMVWTDLTKRAIPWTEHMIRRRRLLNDLNVDITGRLSVLLLGAVLLALMATAAIPAAGLVALAATTTLAAVNLPFYRFLARGNGWWFALRAIPLHWLYYLLCGVGFVIGAGRAALIPRSLKVISGEKAKAA